MTAQVSSVGRSSPGLERLTRRHGVKLCTGPGVSVEECSLAVGEVVGFGSVKSASRMNSAVVIFVESTEKANQLVESGVVIRGALTPVLPLGNPARKVLISNVPPFLKNSLLEKELSRHGQIVSPIKLIPLGCKSPKLRHVVSFRRQVFMVLSGKQEINVIMRFRIDEFDYTVHVSSDNLKCFGCGAEGHLIRSCPDGGGARRSADAEAPPPVSVGGLRVGQRDLDIRDSEMRGEALKSTVTEGALIHSVSQSTEREHGAPGGTHCSEVGAVGSHGEGSPASDSQKEDGSELAGVNVHTQPELGLTGLNGGLLEEEEGDVVMDEDFLKSSSKRKITEKIVKKFTKVSKVDTHGISHTDVTSPDMHTGSLDMHTCSQGAHTVIQDAHTDSQGAHTEIQDAHTDSQGAHTVLQDTHTGSRGAHTALSCAHTDSLDTPTLMEDTHADALDTHMVSQHALGDSVLTDSQATHTVLEEHSDSQDLLTPSQDAHADSQVIDAGAPSLCAGLGGDQQSQYSFQRIKSFLKDTKGMRLVRLEAYFSDLQVFHDSVGHFMRNPGNLGQDVFSEQEIFRLKKFLTKIRKRASQDDQF
ncbi:uncharacterized protein LOC114469487 [Gouania willdenowi]|uniref:uncharacterized protein LOC114469487 n=1 Tax=Gouania willdenowi TaxID=441366 RepID=UPI0010556813|nr:uncharacterized protein LOC114469487 [Gouania willdenowi]